MIAARRGGKVPGRAGGDSLDHLTTPSDSSQRRHERNRLFEIATTKMRIFYPSNPVTVAAQKKTAWSPSQSFKTVSKRQRLDQVIIAAGLLVLLACFMVALHTLSSLYVCVDHRDQLDVASSHSLGFANTSYCLLKLKMIVVRTD